MPLRRAVITLMLAMASTLAACAQPAHDDGLTRVEWIAQSINGKPVINPGKVTLTFADGRVSGRAGCNQYSGPVEFAQSRVKIGPLISTKMACLGDGLMQQESEYLATLGAADTYALTGNGALVLRSASGGELSFGKRAP